MREQLNKNGALGKFYSISGKTTKESMPLRKKIAFFSVSWHIEAHILYLVPGSKGSVENREYGANP